MSRRHSASFIGRLRATLVARYESFFPAPNDTRLVQILGGTTLTIGRVRRRDRPFTITLSRGRLLRSERFRRAVLNDMGVLANDVKMAIAIQGPEYEHDVVAAYNRDEWLQSQGWVVRYIPLNWLYEKPGLVKQTIAQFI